MQSPDSARLAERGARLKDAFGRAEKQLGAGPYFNGETLGNVDLAWLPLLHRAQLVEAHSGYDLLADFPKVKAWQGVLATTGLYAKSVSESFDEAFSAFYLSERTYLGRGADPTEVSAAPNASSSSACCG